MINNFIALVNGLTYYQPNTINFYETKNGDSFEVCSTLFCRIIYQQRQTKYEIRTKLLEFLNAPEIIVVDNKKDNKDDGYFWSKVTFFGDIYEIILKYAVKIYEWCYCQQDMDSFGCCNSYLECSDNKACVHPDPLFAKACWYNRNLKKGLIFYGKNKNI